MKVYDINFLCSDETKYGMITFNCGLASILIVQGVEKCKVLGQIYYVGII